MACYKDQSRGWVVENDLEGKRVEVVKEDVAVIRWEVLEAWSTMAVAVKMDISEWI